jgi:hypothetical protein
MNMSLNVYLIKQMFKTNFHNNNYTARKKRVIILPAIFVS